MCGIIGYTGKQDAAKKIISGLKRLEYRGYDSAGIALKGDNILKIIKTQGKIEKLKAMINGENSNLVIGHTRWATHGEPSHINAHPHTSEGIAIVHNGIIENHASLRKELEHKYNYKFQSQTDSEVIAHLIDFFYDGNFEEAFRKMLTKIDGAFALTLTSTGITTVEGALGFVAAIAGLTHTAGGNLRLGADIRSTGAIAFNSPILLTSNSNIYASSTITTAATNGTIDGPFDLVMETTGGNTPSTEAGEKESVNTH